MNFRHICKSGLLLALAATFALAGCEKPLPPVLSNPPQYIKPEDPDPKIFIMYDNIGDGSPASSYDDWFTENVNAAGRAVASGALAKGQRVIVFHRLPAGSVIYELERDVSTETAGFVKKTLKTYPAGTNYAFTVETISTVIEDIRTLTPEGNHYGFAFGSHGMGWIPKSFDAKQLSRRASSGMKTIDGQTFPEEFAELWAKRENPKTRYFASDTNEKLDVSEFITALGNWKWDFILFDDCFMASVEAVYDMRRLADYFIVSPTEIMIQGFPYDRVVDTIFNEWEDMAGVGREYVDYYRSYVHPYATVAVVKTSELETLATTVKAIRQAPAGVNEVDPVQSGIQSYEGLRNHVFFDLDNYMQALSRDDALLAAFRTQLDKTVVWSGHTDNFYSDIGAGGVRPITHFSGLAVFIPWSGTSTLRPLYEQTAWYEAVYQN